MSTASSCGLSAMTAAVAIAPAAVASISTAVAPAVASTSTAVASTPTAVASTPTAVAPSRIAMRMGDRGVAIRRKRQRGKGKTSEQRYSDVRDAGHQIAPHAAQNVVVVAQSGENVVARPQFR